MWLSEHALLLQIQKPFSTMSYIKLSFAFFFIASAALAQEIVSSHGMKKPNSRGFNVFFNDADSLLNVLFIEKKEITSLKYNKSKDRVAQKVFETEKRRKYKEHLGHVLNNNGNLNMYFTNSRKRGLMLAVLDTQNDTFTYQDMDIDFDRQSYLYSVAHDNKFYILTIDTQVNLILHEIDGTNHGFTKFPVSELKYKTSPTDQEGFISKALKTGFNGSVGDSKLVALEENLPNSIELVSNESKLIKRDDKLFIIVDLDDTRTDVLEISLENKKLAVRSFDQPLERFEDLGGIKSNSYLHENKIYQVAVSNDQLVLDIKNYDTAESIKSFEVNRDDKDIPFKNTPIIQLGGAYEDYRELDRTRQLLRKMSNSFPGVAVYRYNDQLEITVGGSKEVQNAGVGFGMAFGAMGGAMSVGGVNVDIGFQPFYNPYFMSYDMGVKSKSTFIVGLFNNDINHMIGDIPGNIWDRLETFTEDLNPYMENIIPREDHILYSYYDKKAREYKLVRFDRQ